MGVNQTYALGSAIMSAGLPISDVTVPYLGAQGESGCTYPTWSGNTLRVKWSSGPTAQNLTDLTSVISSFDGSQSGLDNFQKASDKAAAKANMAGGVDPNSRLSRAIASVILDQFNTVRAWDMSLKAAVAAATNLANLQTRIAALPNLPQLTLSDVQTAISNKIDTNGS